MKKAFLLASLIIPAMLIANFASVLSNKSSNPIITWSPQSIEEKISPGDTSELNVVFENKEDLRNIELWLTPELKDFITFTPEYFDSIPANTKNSIHLKISVSTETPLGVYYGTLHVRAGKRTIPQTLKITLEISEPLSEGNLTTMLETHKEAAQNFDEWLEIYGREEARQMTVDWLKSQNNVQETGISNDGTIWILFTNGIGGDIETYPPGTLGGSGGNGLISPSSLQKIVNKINAAVFSGLTSQPFITSNQPIVVGNDRVIVLDPFLDELGEKSPQSYIYSKIFPLTNTTYLKNEEVTIDVIKTIYGYGVVNITTHGRLHRDVVGFLSGEKVTPINIFFHIGDLRNKRLSIGWHGLTPYYEILPAFITNYAKESYPESLIYIGACQSLKNTTMANAFLNREAATYFGFTRTTSTLFNREKAEELFTNLVDNRQTTGEAFTNGIDPYWSGPDPEYGYETESAKFEMVGASNLIFLLPPPLVESPWPMFQHDSHHTGQSPYIGPQTDYVKWIWVAPHDPSEYYYLLYPIIGRDGTIFINGKNQRSYLFLHTINPDGTFKWTFDTEIRGNISFAPAIGKDDIIYFTIDNAPDNHRVILYAINSTGSLKWTYFTDISRGPITNPTSPVIDPDGTIYIGSNDFYLYAINFDGTLKWRFNINGAPINSPALGWDGTVYISSTDNNFYAINPNGTLKWKYNLPKTNFSSSSISLDGTIYVGGYTNLYAINPDGAFKWVFITNGVVNSTPAVEDNGTIYIGSTDKRLYAINPDGTLKWSYLTDSMIFSSTAIDLSGAVYIISTRYIYVLNLDGKLKWNYFLNHSNSSPAIGSVGNVYLGTVYGELYAFGK